MAPEGQTEVPLDAQAFVAPDDSEHDNKDPEVPSAIGPGGELLLPPGADTRERWKATPGVETPGNLAPRWPEEARKGMPQGPGDGGREEYEAYQERTSTSSR